MARFQGTNGLHSLILIISKVLLMSFVLFEVFDIYSDISILLRYLSIGAFLIVIYESANYIKKFFSENFTFNNGFNMILNLILMSVYVCLFVSQFTYVPSLEDQLY